MRVGNVNPMRCMRLALAVGAMVVAIASEAVSQSPALSPRVPVTVAIADDGYGPEPFRLLRRSIQEPRDVILLSPTATADDLSDAIGDLLAARRAQGDTASSTGVIRIRRMHSTPLHPRRYPWAGRVFSDVRTAPLLEIPGVGRVRALTIWLPPQRRNGTAHP